MRKLVFSQKEWLRLVQLCEAGYPKEVCGLIFGHSPNGNANQCKVLKVEPLSNMLDGQHSERLQELIRANSVSLDSKRARGGGNFEFLIDPQEHYRKVSGAEREGLDLLGIFHSHPDHPARPSSVDTAQPFLAGWSNLIVAVHSRKFKEAQSWFRDSEETAFQKENILVE